MRGFVGISKLSAGRLESGLVNRLLQEFSLGRSLNWQRYESPEGRFSIALCSPASQRNNTRPVTSADGRWVSFLNGEIYNSDLIREDQAQALLDAYLNEGDELFVRLNGTFAWLLYAPNSQRWQFLCDRTASQPIFYLATEDHFMFSTRLKPFGQLPRWTPKINGSAVASFLSNGYLLQDQVLWRDVAQLGPGQMLIGDARGFKIRQYWDFTLTSHTQVSDEAAYSEELARLLLQSIGQRSQEGSHLGVLLSGGYDSRAIAGSMKRLWPGRTLTTITWGKAADELESDAFIAEQLAAHLGAKHAFFKLDASTLPNYFRSFVTLDEGRTDAVGNYPEALRIFKRIRDDLGVEVLLRGDECFGWKEDVRRESEVLHSLEIHELSKLSESYGFLDPGSRRILEEINRRQNRQILSACPYLNLHDRKDYLYFKQRLRGYLNPLTQLKQIELDLRNPFLDNEILDFVGLLPMKLRLGKALFKGTVERLFPEFQVFDFAKQSSLIDWEQRLGSDADLQAYIRIVLLEQTNDFDQIVNRRKLERFLTRVFATTAAAPNGKQARSANLWRRLRRRLQRQQGYYELSPSTQLFRLMILKIWTDEFMKGEFNLSG